MACPRIQTKRKRHPRTPPTQTASQHHLSRQKAQADDLDNDHIKPRNSDPKQEHGINTAKTPEDSPTDKQDNNATTPKKHTTIKLGLDTKTPSADHPTAVKSRRIHIYPIATYDEYNFENTPLQMVPHPEHSPIACSPKAPTDTRNHQETWQC